MPDRTRPIRKEICLNEQEMSVVRHKMNQLAPTISARMPGRC